MYYGEFENREFNFFIPKLTFTNSLLGNMVQCFNYFCTILNVQLLNTDLVNISVMSQMFVSKPWI